MAAKPLIEGYCQEFVALAMSLQQTLGQIEARGIDLGTSLDILSSTAGNMSWLADAIRAMVERQAAAQQRKRAPGRKQRRAAPPATKPEARPAAPRQAALPIAAPGDTAEQLWGDTQVISLGAVMQFLSRVRKSGTLHVDVGKEHVTFEFVNGVIEGSTSNRSIAGERLGEILVAMFPMHRERLQAALSHFTNRRSARRLGAELVQAGIASNGQVVEALEKQVHARFLRIVSAPQAKYVFDEGERVPSDGRIRIRPFELEHAGRFRAR